VRERGSADIQLSEGCLETLDKPLDVYYVGWTGECEVMGNRDKEEDKEEEKREEGSENKNLKKNEVKLGEPVD